jgi:hypothetical protein
MWFHLMLPEIFGSLSSGRLRCDSMQSSGLLPSYPLTGRGGLWGCEMLTIPHCLDNRLTDGSKVVSPMHWLQSTPQKHYFSVSGTHFSQRLSKPQGLVLPEGLGKFKKLIHLIGSRTCDLRACSRVPWPLCYCMPHIVGIIYLKFTSRCI